MAQLHHAQSGGNIGDITHLGEVCASRQNERVAGDGDRTDCALFSLLA